MFFVFVFLTQWSPGKHEKKFNLFKYQEFKLLMFDSERGKKKQNPTLKGCYIHSRPQIFIEHLLYTRHFLRHCAAHYSREGLDNE